METVQLIETLANAAAPGTRHSAAPYSDRGLASWSSPPSCCCSPPCRACVRTLARQLQTPSFIVGTAASLLTGGLAALGCLVASLPDRSRSWLLLPLPPLAVWLATLGHGCLTDWVSYDEGSLRLGSAVRCFTTVLLISLPLSALMFAMLRHVARLRPAPVTLAAGLAVAGVTSTAMSLLYRH